MHFMDPITKYDTLSGYLLNIAMLRLLFHPVYDLHGVTQTGPNELTTRWTMTMDFWLIPWRPQLVFTGTSIMALNPATSKFNSHIDTWDSIRDQEWFSKQGFMDLLAQASQLSFGRKPATHRVLKRLATYEVRKFDPLGATHFQPRSSSQLEAMLRVATCRAFSEVADERLRSGGEAAVRKIGGSSLGNARLAEEEQDLRQTLVSDGLAARDGSFVSVPDPSFVPTFLRTTELLIWLDDFELLHSEKEKMKSQMEAK
eukprot:SM000045S16259  [mRNA]  locus=s45:490902:493372:- [translate_table: standard]